MRKKKKEERIQDIRQIQKLKREKKKLETAPGSDYKTEYCSMLLDHCSQGYSFKSFAARINVLPETLEKWTKEHPEFEAAKSKAELKQRMFWEAMAIEACREKFSVHIFRYFIGDTDEMNPLEPKAVVLLPKEDISK